MIDASRQSEIDSSKNDKLKWGIVEPLYLRYVKKTAETQTSIRIGSHLVRVPN